MKTVVVPVALAAISITSSAFATTVPAGYAVTSASTLLQENGYIENDNTVSGTISATTASKRSSGEGTAVFSKGPDLTANGFAAAEIAPSGSVSDPVVSGQNRGEGTAKAVFWMAVDGPAANATVPIRVISNGTFQVTGGFYAGPDHDTSAASASGSLIAQWYDGTGYIDGAVHQSVENPNELLVDVEASVSYGAGDTGGKKTASINLNQEFDFTNKSLYQITMSIEACAQIIYDTKIPILNDGNLSAEAFLDPYFEIDPAYAKLGYTLSFSDGINNSLVSAVPLPASSPMFGAALLALGAFGYGVRRKKAVTLA